ncbi:MAG TPA: class I SAM-dependent methyltransferase [Chloroflexota bacterium]|jgi:23S rRNA (cytosine1962-C5)-methyltransferase
MTEPGRDRAHTSDLSLLLAEGWENEYLLLDSGAGRRLERFGRYVLDRPEPNALWRPGRPEADWVEADARFDEGWSARLAMPEHWEMRFPPLGLRFLAGCSPFRHTGVFPEQAAHWTWLAGRIAAAGRPAHVLVLFGYTGLATLALAGAGARVTHVDASRPAMAWARRNAAVAGLDDRPIRWLIDDALKLLRRDARRGIRYDGIVMDPPAFGRGPSGEVWRFNASLPPLLEAAAAVLARDPLLLLLNAYAVPASATLLANLVGDLVPDRGRLEAGELALEGGGRRLATGPFARWSAL